MMVTSPIAARISAVRGPRFTLTVGALIICGAYLAGLLLLAAPWQIMLLNVMVAVGVGFGYASMPALINAAVPVSETAAANGINALARSLGTAISSAVIGAILAGMTMSFAGRDIPTLTGLRVALLVAAGAAGLAALLTLLIPKATAFVVATRHNQLPPATELEPVIRTPCSRSRGWSAAPTWCATTSTKSGDVTLGQLADQFEIDVPTASRHVAALLREGLATGAGRGDSLSFWLTPRGRDRLYQERAHGLRQN